MHFRLKNSLHESMPIKEKMQQELATLEYVSSLSVDGSVTRDGYNFWIDSILDVNLIDSECENFNLIRVVE